LFDPARFRQELLHGIFGIAVLFGGHRHLDPITSGKNHSLHQARTMAQAVEGLGKSVVGERQALAHFDRRRVVAKACDQQLHAASLIAMSLMELMWASDRRAQS